MHVTINNSVDIVYQNEKRSSFWTYAAAGKWEPDTFGAIDRFVFPKSTFIDIGAWIGAFSIYAAKKKKATVFAVEPDVVAFSELSNNVHQNQCELVNCFQQAIAGESGLVYLNSMNGDFGNSESSLLVRGKAKVSIEVYATTLEDFFERRKILCDTNLSLIKMDIEGGEIEVIKQSKRFLDKFSPTMYISLHPAWYPNEAQDLEEIADVIFPIYNVSLPNRMEVTRDNFIEVVNNHNHDIILISK